MLPELSNQGWALTETPESSHAEVECHRDLTAGLVTALLISVSLPLSQMDAYAQLLTAERYHILP